MFWVEERPYSGLQRIPTPALHQSYRGNRLHATSKLAGTLP